MFGLILYCSFSSLVSHLQAGSRWYRDAGGICSRGKILHRIPPPAERRADHPGELPQPDHTGNNPSPSKVSRVNQRWMLHLNWPRLVMLFSVFLCGRMATLQNSCWRKASPAAWTGPWLFTRREPRNSELLNGKQLLTKEKINTTENIFDSENDHFKT